MKRMIGDWVQIVHFLPWIDWANKNLNVKLCFHLIVSFYLRAKHLIQETRDQEGTFATCKLNDGN